MTRSGYSDDFDYNWTQIKWRGQVASAIRGKRGQTFLRDLRDALDAMPEKRLIAEDLIVTPDRLYGPPTRADYYRSREYPIECGVCAIGAVGIRRSIDMSCLDPEDYDSIADSFGIAHQLVQEIEWHNDEGGDYNETPEMRWCRMREWVERQITGNSP